MRSPLTFHSLLFVLAWGSLCGFLKGQEYQSADMSTDRVDSVLNAPDPSDHAGLLGKVYMQQLYLYLDVDDPNIRQIDKSLQGFDAYVNLPVMTLDWSIPLDFDVFMGYTNAGLKGTTAIGPPVNVQALLNAKAEVYSVGTTIYPTLSEHWRPFVQVGAEFSRADLDIVINTPLGTFADNVVDHDSDLLLNAGFEFDVLDYLGYRMSFDIETSDRFQDSMMFNELILWPHEKIFVRGGMASSLDGGGLGFAIGGGLAF